MTNHGILLLVSLPVFFSIVGMNMHSINYCSILCEVQATKVLMQGSIYDVSIISQVQFGYLLESNPNA